MDKYDALSVGRRRKLTIMALVGGEWFDTLRPKIKTIYVVVVFPRTVKCSGEKNTLPVRREDHLAVSLCLFSIQRRLQYGLGF